MSVVDMSEEELYQHQTDIMKDTKQQNQDEPLNFLKYIKAYKFDKKINTNNIK